MTGGVDSQKFWEGPNLLTLNEQQHFVWDTASQKHKITSYARIWLRLCTWQVH